MRIYKSFLMDLEKKTHTLEIYLITAAIKPTLPRRIPVFASISGSDQRQRSVEHQGCGRTPASCWLGTWKCKVEGGKISTGCVHFLEVKMVKIGEHGNGPLKVEDVEAKNENQRN